jgi:two-component system response regulator MprA
VPKDRKGTVPSGALEAVSRGKTILVVEDQPALREALETFLTHFGHRVIPVTNGHEALQAAAAHDIDFAVIDMMIPGPSGFQVLHAVKARAGQPPVRAVMMSGNGSPAHQEYAASLGADGFLVKPFPFADLLWVFQKYDPPPSAEPAPATAGAGPER